MSRFQKRRLFSRSQAGLLAACAAFACSDVPGVADPGNPEFAYRPVGSITITPLPATITVGQSQQFIAVVKDSRGHVVTPALYWTTTDSAYLKVTQAGLATAVAAGDAYVRASSGNVTGSAPVTLVAAPAPEAASITITPLPATMTVGQELQFTAEVKDAEGQVISAPLYWTTTDSAFLKVTQAGVATAVAAGDVYVRASSGNVTGSAPVTLVAAPLPPPPPPPPPADTTVPPPPPPPADTTVPPPPPPPIDTTVPPPPPPAVAEPAYQAGSGTLVWQDNFDGYASDAALMANYITINGHEQHFHVAPGGGLDGSNAVRYDWTPRGDCADDSRLLERGLPGGREYYVQYSIRYTTGFAFDWLYSGYSPCTGNAKKLFFFYSGQGSRFDFISENHWLGMGGDYDHPLLAQNVGPVMSTDTWGDGSWHRVTIHVVQSSAPETPDGLIEAWIDGVKRWYHPNWASRSSGGWTSFRIGANINQGAPKVQNEWVDNVTIWRP